MSQLLWNIAGRSRKVSGASPPFWSWSVCDAIDEQLRPEGRRSAAVSPRLFVLYHPPPGPLFSHLCWETTREPPRVADVPSAEVCSIP